jgi:hypothetical protein
MHFTNILDSSECDFIGGCGCEAFSDVDPEVILKAESAEENHGLRLNVVFNGL